jgi:hypothetical protein
MTAALGTLPFLATLWLVVVLGAAVLEESGAKIAAALKGEPLPLPKVRGTPARHGPRTAANRPMRANVEWRAAA